MAPQASSTTALALGGVRHIRKTLGQINYLLRELIDISHLAESFLISVMRRFPDREARNLPEVRAWRSFAPAKNVGSRHV
jgi:hypothetical protein